MTSKEFDREPSKTIGSRRVYRTDETPPDIAAIFTPALEALIESDLPDDGD